MGPWDHTFARSFPFITPGLQNPTIAQGFNNPDHVAQGPLRQFPANGTAIVSIKL